MLFSAPSVDVCIQTLMSLREEQQQQQQQHQCTKSVARTRALVRFTTDFAGALRNICVMDFCSTQTCHQLTTNLVGMPVTLNFVEQVEVARVHSVETYPDGSMYLMLDVVHEDLFDKVVIEGALRQLTMSWTCVLRDLSVRPLVLELALESLGFVAKSLFIGAGDAEWSE